MKNNTGKLQHKSVNKMKMGIQGRSVITTKKEENT